MADVLAKSSNIGAINIGLKVGDQALFEYVRRFGFGRKTGIDLPGESAGLLRRVEQWTPSSIGSIAMGHEVSATALQLAIAGAVIANGGLRVRPQIVLCRRKPGEPEERSVVDKPVRVIAPETAITMRQMMEGVVLRGTGKGLANLRGYTSGGKTGTAQIFDVKGHVYTHAYNASFVGFAPVANPKIVIAVTLNATTGGAAGYGGPVAAPVFREVAMSALRMLDVPKDVPEKASPAEKAPAEKASPAGGSAPAGTQSVSSVTPPPVQTDPPAADADGSPASNLDRRSFLETLSARKTPDFRGMSLRAVLEESSAAGLLVEVEGSGLARNQDPPPGAPLTAQERVRVQFGR
jgi:cell division protein FtsI (penicillin-binding protein 3)